MKYMPKIKDTFPFKHHMIKRVHVYKPWSIKNIMEWSHFISNITNSNDMIKFTCAHTYADTRLGCVCPMCVCVCTQKKKHNSNTMIQRLSQEEIKE